MAFNIDKLFDFSIQEINNFADSHQHELFYGFAIDSSLLCLNSEEVATKSLQQYQNDWERDHRAIDTWDELTERDIWQSENLLGIESRYAGLDLSDRDACLSVINRDRSEDRSKGNPYYKNDEIYSLRSNTGDWAYQGFAEMRTSNGFDNRAYNVHYNLNDEQQKMSAYGKAMNELVAKLIDANAFSCLKLSPNFYAIRVEHRY